MMIKAVLLDLDGTLLLNDDAVIVPAYFDAVDRYFRTHLQRAGMRQALIDSVRAMATPREDFAPNRTAALRAIVAAVTEPETVLLEVFDSFYAEAYAELRAYTDQTPVARQLYDLLLEKDYAVVIATNPVYPAVAVQQRLAWAGLPDDLSAYAFVTTGDNMHFIKPNPAYYAEVLARVGVEPDEAVMIGNSRENDIDPAETLGLTTYHITKDTPLDTFYEAVKDGWLASIQPRPLHPAMILPELQGNVGALFGLLAEVKPHQWTQHPDPDEWSILQVVQHLWEREIQVQRPRLERIVAEDNPFISPPSSPDNPPEVDTVDGMAAAKAFAAERAKTTAWLAELPPDAWSRPAQHSIFSQTTLMEMAHFTAQHDRMHITQICQTLGKCD